MRLSSIQKGDYFRPGVYSVIEDVVGVDGNGGRPFREALDARYRASPRFQRMLVQLSFFWSLPALLLAGGLSGIIFAVTRTVGFGIG